MEKRVDNVLTWDEYFMGIAHLSALRSKEGDVLTSKYAFVVHAELNAILNSQRSVRGCTIYVSLFPCNECAKAIIQSGIKKIVYESDKYNGVDTNIASKRMLRAAGVELVRISNTISIQVEKKINEESSTNE